MTTLRFGHNLSTLISMFNTKNCTTKQKKREPKFQLNKHLNKIKVDRLLLLYVVQFIRQLFYCFRLGQFSFNNWFSHTQSCMHITLQTYIHAIFHSRT